VESKSFKLYLNSFNNTRIDDAAEVRQRIARDISQAVWHGGVEEIAHLRAEAAFQLRREFG
jgi:7-cyano-7-deazaguanine reductase